MKTLPLLAQNLRCWTRGAQSGGWCSFSALRPHQNAFGVVSASRNHEVLSQNPEWVHLTSTAPHTASLHLTTGRGRLSPGLPRLNTVYLTPFAAHHGAQHCLAPVPGLCLPSLPSAIAHIFPANIKPTLTSSASCHLSLCTSSLLRWC